MSFFVAHDSEDGLGVLLVEPLADYVDDAEGVARLAFAYPTGIYFEVGAPVDIADTFVSLLDDLRDAVHMLGNHDEGSAAQADAVLQLSEALFKDLTAAARGVIAS